MCSENHLFSLSSGRITFYTQPPEDRSTISATICTELGEAFDINAGTLQGGWVSVHVLQGVWVSVLILQDVWVSVHVTRWVCTCGCATRSMDVCACCKAGSLSMSC